MYFFSRLLSLSFNAKSYIIWLKILFWYFPADILHLLHSRLVSSSLATRLCHSIWIFDVFCKSNFPFLKRAAWVSPGNFLLLICIKTGFGQLLASISHLPKKAGIQQVARAKARQGPKKAKMPQTHCCFSRGTLQPLPAEISRLCRDFMRDNTEISALTALKSLLERHLCSVDGTNAAAQLF